MMRRFPPPDRFPPQAAGLGRAPDAVSTGHRTPPPRWMPPRRCTRASSVL